MKKFCSLTFDDGPCKKAPDTMNDMLDILEKHGVVASFFLIGNKITEENKKTIRRAFEMGCDIENHSWTHTDMTKLTQEQVAEEYKKCDDAIIKITGERPVLFRPPYISVNDEMFKTIPTPFICGQGCEDWIQEVKADERFNRMINDAKDGVMFLLHVMENNTETLKATDRLIPALKAQGYEFVTAPELFRLKGHPEKAHDGKLWSYV